MDTGFTERVRGDQEPRLGDGPEDDEDKNNECQYLSREEQEANRRKFDPSSLVKPAEFNARLEDPSIEPDQEMEVFLDDDSNRSIRIGKDLSSVPRIDLIQLLRDYKDIFA